MAPQLPVGVSRFRTLWGLEPGPKFQNWGVLFHDFKKHGYAGVEIDVANLGTNEEDYKLVRQLAENAGIQITALIFSEWPQTAGFRPTGLTVKDHLAFYRSQLKIARALDAVKVNCHSGSDFWSVDESVEFYRATFAIDADMGFAGRVSHETHRNRALYNPYNTDAILKQVPDLLITADFSHWVVVCERLLVHKEDREILERVIPRISHVHARMGTTQASQCPEPTNPAFAEERAFFEDVWQRILDSHFARDGASTKLTFVPEYGLADEINQRPFPYHPINSKKSFGEVADEEGARLQGLWQQRLAALSG